MDNELYHWKYLKREKVGGKWKYYYDTSSLKTDIKKSIDTKKSVGVGKDAKARMQAAKANLDKATVKRNIAIKAETKATGESYVGENIRRRTQHRAIQNDSENKRDYYNKQADKESLRPLPRFSEQFKNKSMAEVHDKNAELAKAGVEHYQKELDKDIERLSSHRKKSDAAIKEYAKAAEEYAKAQKEYFNTPIGKLDKAKESIEKARDYVYELFDDSPEIRAKRAAKHKRKK